MLFTQKYSPHSLAELAGNEEAFSKMRRWAFLWAKGERPQPLLLFGPCGVGKTCSVHALAEEFSWDLLELNSSSSRTSEAISDFLGAASSSSGLFGNKKLLLIDDADFAAGEDRGSASAFAKIASSAQQPLIITATDAYNKNLAPLRGICEKTELKKVNVHALLLVLKRVCKAEKIQLSDEELSLIAQNSQGDVRAALNDLQARNFSPLSREREKNIFEVVRGIFKATKYSECRPLMMSCSVPNDTLKLWIEENIPIEYEKPSDIAAAFNSLSRSDMFDGRIRNRQYWGFLRYSTDLMGAGVALSKEAPYRKFTAYAYPSYIRTMGATKEKRSIRKSLSRKFATNFHCSLWAGMDYVQLFTLFAKQDAAHTCAAYSIEVPELAYLLGTTSEKAQKLLEGKGENPKKPKKSNAAASEKPQEVPAVLPPGKKTRQKSAKKETVAGKTAEKTPMPEKGPASGAKNEPPKSTPAEKTGKNPPEEKQKSSGRQSTLGFD
ncbi:Replication factor C large subunit [Candidatus Anstonella stagnisolia]|nr:Replication factor C large subunit [Candidatus Anstonella stagnisolia]